MSFLHSLGKSNDVPRSCSGLRGWVDVPGEHKNGTTVAAARSQIICLSAPMVHAGWQGMVQSEILQLMTRHSPLSDAISDWGD